MHGRTYNGPAHRVRNRRPPRRRLTGRSFWILIVGAALTIGVSGAVTASFVIGTFAYNPPQSAASGSTAAPPGLSYVQALAFPVGPSTTPASGACNASNLGTLATPTALTNGASTAICLNAPATGFLAGDVVYTFEVSWSTLAAVSTPFEIQIGVDVMPSANSIVATAYVSTTATITPYENATFSLDMTAAGDTSVVQYSLLVTQL